MRKWRITPARDEDIVLDANGYWNHPERPEDATSDDYILHIYEADALLPGSHENIVLVSLERTAKQLNSWWLPLAASEQRLSKKPIYAGPKQ